MLKVGKAYKVSIYLSEGGSGKSTANPLEILSFLFYRGVAGATVLKGVAGFGADHHIHSSSFVELSDHLPVKIEFIETEEKIDELLGKLSSMCGSGMIEIQETRIAKAASARSDAEVAYPARRVQGPARMVRIYVSKDDVWNDKPLHVALVEAMRANDISGVTVYEGLMGYGASGRQQTPGEFSKGRPVMLSVVDTPERIENLLPVLERMVDRGMVAVSDVEVIKYSHSAAPSVQQQESNHV